MRWSPPVWGATGVLRNHGLPSVVDDVSLDSADLRSRPWDSEVRRDGLGKRRDQVYQRGMHVRGGALRGDLP